VFDTCETQYPRVMIHPFLVGPSGTCPPPDEERPSWREGSSASSRESPGGSELLRYSVILEDSHRGYFIRHYTPATGYTLSYLWAGALRPPLGASLARLAEPC
jgi:hypothetical protein